MRKSSLVFGAELVLGSLALFLLEAFPLKKIKSVNFSLRANPPTRWWRLEWQAKPIIATINKRHVNVLTGSVFNHVILLFGAILFYVLYVEKEQGSKNLLKLLAKAFLDHEPSFVFQYFPC